MTPDGIRLQPLMKLRHQLVANDSKAKPHILGVLKTAILGFRAECPPFDGQGVKCLRKAVNHVWAPYGPWCCCVPFEGDAFWILGRAGGGSGASSGSVGFRAVP